MFQYHEVSIPWGPYNILLKGDSLLTITIVITHIKFVKIVMMKSLLM